MSFLGNLARRAWPGGGFLNLRSHLIKMFLRKRSSATSLALSSGGLFLDVKASATRGLASKKRMRSLPRMMSTRSSTRTAGRASTPFLARRVSARPNRGSCSIISCT